MHDRHLKYSAFPSKQRSPAYSTAQRAAPQRLLPRRGRRRLPLLPCAFLRYHATLPGVVLQMTCQNNTPGHPYGHNQTDDSVRWNSTTAFRCRVRSVRLSPPVPLSHAIPSVQTDEWPPASHAQTLWAPRSSPYASL